MSYSNLYVYYKIVFAMAQHHKYSITDIEEMIPFERDIYLDMLISFIEEVKQEQERNK